MVELQTGSLQFPKGKDINNKSAITVVDIGSSP